MTKSEFAIFEHKAKKRGLHFDLRFQMPSSQNWASFAMNEFPSDKPGVVKYITRTSDHNRENALFTGTIPDNEYGAGTIKKLDSGKCDIIKFSNASMTVVFKGKRLKGKYFFINMAIVSRNTQQKRKNVYKFFKAKDQSVLENYLEIIQK